jgi:hypothetical protein
VLVLTADGKKYQQKLQVVPDPRVHIDSASYAAQLDLSRKICDLMESDARAFNSVVALHKEFDARKTALPTTPPKELLDALAAFEKQLTVLEDGTNDAPGFGPINRDLGRDLQMVQSADMRPAESARNAVVASCNLYLKNVAASEKLNSDALASLNALLAAQKLPPLQYAPPRNSTLSCTP